MCFSPADMMLDLTYIELLHLNVYLLNDCLEREREWRKVGKRNGSLLERNCQRKPTVLLYARGLNESREWDNDCKKPPQEQYFDIAFYFLKRDKF